MSFHKATIAIFFAVIIIFPILTFSLPKETFSELENRDLKKAPTLSLDTIENKKFMNDAETYMADHMVFRAALTKMKTTLERVVGKTEINDVFIGKNRLLENVKKPNSSTTNTNINAINAFAEKYGEKLDLNMMLIPSAIEFYSQELPLFATPFDQAKYIKEVYEKLKDVSSIDAYSALNGNANKYIFYRTDHHWTSYGAFVGYTALAKGLGYKAATSDMFNIEHASYDFLGTLYSKVICEEELKDSIDLYHFAPASPVTGVTLYNGRNELTYPTIFFKENLAIKDKYTVFLGENTPVVKIKTNIQNGKKLLLFKDSYSHSLMQFLPLHYEEIALIDLRYLNVPLEEYVNIRDYKQALFLYSLPNFVTDTSLMKLSTY